MKQSHKTILLWLALILMFVSIYHLFTDPSGKEKELSVLKFKDQIADVKKAAEIERVDIRPAGRDNAKYIVTYKNGGPKAIIHAEFNSEMTGALSKANVEYKVKPEEESTFWQSLIISWLPMIFLFVIFFFFMRQLQSGGGKAMSFGKSKAKLLTDNQNKITAFWPFTGVDADDCRLSN